MRACVRFVCACVRVCRAGVWMQEWVPQGTLPHAYVRAVIVVNDGGNGPTTLLDSKTMLTTWKQTQPQDSDTTTTRKHRHSMAFQLRHKV